jgi:hypothetical protein
MSPAAFHFAILRSAALLVPEPQRMDWLAEWRSELWHVRRNPGEASATAFCLGAFRDAFWLRRDGPILPPPGVLRLNLPATPVGIEDFPDAGVATLTSPAQCLWLLAALGALSFLVTLLMPAARHALLHFPFPGKHRSFEFPRLMSVLTFAGMLVGMLTSGFPQGRPRKAGPRRGLFLAAKTLSMVPIVVFGSLDLGSLGGSVSPLVLHAAFFGGLFAARWILADQRDRCPVCLRLLANPVRMGQPSRILLEWHGTELMCLRGHGMLYVPEWPALWSNRQRWMDLGPSWGGLFP